MYAAASAAAASALAVSAAAPATLSATRALFPAASSLCAVSCVFYFFMNREKKRCKRRKKG